MKSVTERVEVAINSDPELDKYRAEEVFEFLDSLRESGITNMLGARPYIIEEFGIESNEAKKYLTAWMRTF